METIDSYLDQVCRSLKGSKALRLHLREELREHILDSVERHKCEGLAEEQAIRKAIDEFGQPEMVREGLEAIYGRSMVGLLVEKAMQWKEKTMKTGWKWSFVAHFALVATIAIQIILVLSLFVFIFPTLQAEYAMAERMLPSYLIRAVSFLHILEQTWFLWVIVIGVAWAIFEWRCRSDSKSTIRLAIGILASLVISLVVFAIVATVTVPLIQLPGFIRRQQPESVVIRRTERANTSFGNLAQAVQDEDWTTARESAWRLRNEFRDLTYSGSAAPILVGIARRDDIDEVRRLIYEIEELSDDVGDSIRDAERIGEPPGALVPHHFSRLKESYEQLKAKVPGWPG